MFKKLQNFLHGTKPLTAKIASAPPDLQEWFKKAFAKTSNTPDLLQLERKDFQYLFVCDEMMLGFPREHLVLDHAAKVGWVFTQERNFTMWKSNGGEDSFAIPLRKKYAGITPGRIKGELYLVRPYQFTNIDKYKANGLMFKREQVRLIFPYRDVNYSDVQVTHSTTKVRLVKAWMYTGITDHWEQYLDAGYKYSTVKAYQANRPWIDRYFYFSRLECNVEADTK